jgi:uncharacterized DUF497 family protein
VATVRYGDFEWDAEKARANQQKHRVSFEEAITVFSDPMALDAPDLYEAGRFVIIGASARGRTLFVVHAELGATIRIISARKASPTQRRLYEQSP